MGRPCYRHTHSHTHTLSLSLSPSGPSAQSSVKEKHHTKHPLESCPAGMMGFGQTPVLPEHEAICFTPLPFVTMHSFPD